MYKKRLAEVQKEVDNGSFGVNVAEISFLDRMGSTEESEMTEHDKHEISRLWCKI